MLKSIISALFILSLSALLVPVAKAQHTVSNQFISASVTNDGFGLVSISNANRSERFTHGGTSFLTVQINDSVFYSNNVEPMNGNPIPATPIMLTGGTTSQIGDTIRVVWEPQGPNAFQIIQDVYPVAFPLAGVGQIVLRFSVKNLGTAPVIAQAQYLADMDISSGTSENDNPPMTTRFGYMEKSWQNFGARSIPPYFIASEFSIDSAQFPGIVAEGFLNDSLAPEPMGLIEPSLFAYVEWTEIVQDFTWGFPADPIQTEINDEALLLQWPAQNANQGQIVTLGSFSMGTSTPVCFGESGIDAMTLHPDHIIWSGKPMDVYEPNSIPVETVVWNQTNNMFTNVTGTQSITNSATGVVDGPVMISAPNGPPPVYTQTHSLSATTIPPLSATSIAWRDTVFADMLTNCETDSSYDLSFQVAATGAGNTNWVGGSCSSPITVDCQGELTAKPTAPLTAVLDSSGSYDGSRCNTRCWSVMAFDTGAIRVPVTSVQTSSITNMRLSIAPNHAGSDSMFYSVCVIDSMQNGSATLAIADSFGNIGTAEYSYCTIADTHAPLVQVGVCFDSGNGICEWEVSDSQAWDRGLDTVYFSNVVNEDISPIGTIHGLNVLNFQITNGPRPYGFCITAIDLAGNRFDTCYGSVASVSNQNIVPISLSIYPTPMEDASAVLLTGAASASIEIFDVLGREVDAFQIEGSYEWPTSALPAGTYIVRAVVGEQSITKRVVKE